MAIRPCARGRSSACRCCRGSSPTGPNAWAGGTIYDPEGGKTYKSKLRLKGADTLEVDGCVLFFCETQTWTRWRG